MVGLTLSRRTGRWYHSYRGGAPMRSRTALAGIVGAALVGAIAATVSVATAGTRVPRRQEDPICTPAFAGTPARPSNVWIDCRVQAPDSTEAQIFHTARKSGIGQDVGGSPVIFTTSAEPRRSQAFVVDSMGTDDWGIWTLVRAGPLVSRIQFVTSKGDYSARYLGGGYWIAYSPATVSPMTWDAYEGVAISLGVIVAVNAHGTVASEEVRACPSEGGFASMNQCHHITGFR